MTKTLNTKEHTDIKRLTRLERILPAHMRPYLYLLRLDRPVGIWLLLLPSLWGISLASGGLANFNIQTLYVIALFIIGAITMRGAGCVINDLWDRDLDKLVERTKNRPLASGALSVKQGILFLATLLLIGFVILLQFNTTTIILGIITLPLITTYPLMKRITWWPQLFLGLTFNFGALMGWSAITGHIDTPAILMYIGGLFWTIAYDTIYAHQDKEDDAMAGIKSTARLFSTNSKKWVSGFFIAALILFTATLMTNGITPYIALIGLPAAHATLQMRNWDTNDNESSLKTFKSNVIFGLCVLIVCLA
jgi:4-hydroxybenzoate polyprenyltransferase